LIDPALLQPGTPSTAEAGTGPNAANADGDGGGDGDGDDNFAAATGRRRGGSAVGSRTDNALPVVVDASMLSDL